MERFQRKVLTRFFSDKYTQFGVATSFSGFDSRVTFQA